MDCNWRSCVIFYTTAVCNLNCVYCYIDKNEALKKIDDMLDESFKGDYYFDFTKKMFPNPQQLRRVEYWGGETILRLDRAFETTKKLIAYYPNLCEFSFSTNFVSDVWFDEFLGFCDIFREFPQRRFNLFLQLSIDGPEYINDPQRGKGVTKRFIEHFKHFIELKKEDKYPHNLMINFFFKQTLSSFSIPLLQTKEKIIEYYQFFEEFKDLAAYYEDENFSFDVTIPNTACPSPHTQEEGKMFANLCKLCREIEKENLVDKHIFKYYRAITPLAPRSSNYKQCANLRTQGTGNCGMCTVNIGLLPHNRVSLCHNGFVDLIADYKKRCMEDKNLLSHAIDAELFNRNTNVRDTNCSLEEFETFEKIAKAYGEPQHFQLTELVCLIIYLAKGGLIDTKYADVKAATDAALFIENSTSYCIRDNLGSSGSAICMPMGLIKLLLNGAKEYIEDESHLGIGK